MKYYKFSIIAVNLFYLALVVIPTTEAQQQDLAKRKPNFIIILADDLGYADLSMHGSREIQTPHIDALAAEGISMKQGYVSSAVCSPSRAGLLTGKNQVEFGYDNNLDHNQTGFDPQFAGLPVEQKTIATLLKTQGYSTGIIGKWHLGDQEQFHPLNRGFEEFWGYLGGGHDYFESQEGDKNRKIPIESNYKKPAPITYITDDKGDESCAFIKRHSNKPFFLYASFNAPHAPMQALPEDLELYSHIDDINRRTYAAMVHRLDVNVGKILETLKQENLEKNTMVVFLSDNGGPSDQNYSCNAPLNGQKGILLEGGIRVPFIIKWEEFLPAGISYNHPVSSLDLVPTMLEAAGFDSDVHQLTGVNLLPFFLEPKTEAPHASMMWKFTISSAIREGDWKLIRIPDRLPMLYYLPTDISEQHNLAMDRMDLTNKLLKKMGDWEVQLPHPLFMEGAEWKRKQLDLYDKKYMVEVAEATN